MLFLLEMHLQVMLDRQLNITIILRKKISDGFLLKVILKIASLSQKITLKSFKF